MTQNKKQEIENRASEWFNKLVPISGKADTKGGETMRAAMRLLYRYHNDGDVVSEGYGLTTCWSSGRYLVDNAPKPISDAAAELWKHYAGRYDEADEYDNQLHELMLRVVEYLEGSESDANEPNIIECIDWAADYRPEEEYEEEDWDDED